MDAQMQTEKVLIKKEKLCVNIEQIVENDISLADYYGDIVKILGSSVNTNVFSAVITGDKAIIDGSVSVRVLYVDSSGKTEIFETNCPFNRSVDVHDGGENDIISVSSVSDQINCRAVNQRRAEIRGSVSLKICVYSLNNCEMITADEKKDYHTLECKADGYFLTGSMSKCYSLTSSSDVSDELKIKKIYRTSVMPIINEVRNIKNKLMIKGAAVTDVVFLTEDGNFVTERVNIPINQIADMEGIDEESRCCVNLNVRSVDVRLTPDTPQSGRQLEAAVIVSADIDAYRKASINAVSEAYSPSYELICSQSRIKCITDILRVNENHTITSKMDFSSCSGQSIADADVRKIRYTVQSQANSIQLKGNIHFGMVVITGDNEKLFFERIADFEYTKQFGEDVSECDFSPVLSVNAINCSVNGGSEATVSTEIHIDGFVNVLKNMDIVTSVEKGREKDRSSDDGVITVYFASQGERLWDIAKEQGSSVAFIKESNDIDEDVLSNDRMLVFELE